MLDQAIYRKYITNDKEKKYVSDVYKFLAFFIGMFFVGISTPMFFPNLIIIKLASIVFLIVMILMMVDLLSSVISSTLLSFLLGIISHPLISEVINLDKTLLITAIAITLSIFGTASLCAKLFPTKELAALGGLLITTLELFIITGFINLMIGSNIIFTARFYIGFLLFTIFIYYDTQMVFKRARDYALNEYDHQDYNRAVILDSFNIFLDIVNIFIKVLNFLKQINKNKRARV